MKVVFDYETKPSSVFKNIRRPIVKVSFWSKLLKDWLEYTLVVDTGADYTVFPRTFSLDLGIDFKKDCQRFFTRGIGGRESVYFLKKGLKMKVGKFEAKIPVGFLSRDDIPPLLGRHKCLDYFELRFKKFKTYFLT